jgi:hypothetical protein
MSMQRRLEKSIGSRGKLYYIRTLYYIIINYRFIVVTYFSSLFHTASWVVALQPIT